MEFRSYMDLALDEARAAGVEDDLGLDAGASAAEAITRIDRFVCDIKESQYGDGLHIYGAAEGEFAGLSAALAGRFVAAGPAGSPWRGRVDVLPTGRNLYSVDPRAVPSRAAHAQGVKLAEELLRRHLQDKGDWPKGLILDLWGSATMRTAGEEVAMALHLAGLAPRWDEGSERVSGFEVVPLALLGRPRIDVTLRVSGLFRDVFPGLSQMFEAGAAALAERLRVEPREMSTVLETLAALDWVGRLSEEGWAQMARHVLLADPAQTPVGPLAERLLVLRASEADPVWMATGLDQLKLKPLLPLD